MQYRKVSKVVDKYKLSEMPIDRCSHIILIATVLHWLIMTKIESYLFSF